MTRRWRPRRRPSVQPQPLGGMLGEVFHALKLDEPARAFRAMRAFAQAAGPRITQRARAERLRGSTLWVRVVSAAWSHELNVLKQPLLEKLRQTPGGEGIEDLRFSVGPLEDVPDWTQLDGPRPAGTATRAPAAPHPSRELMDALDAVRDAELRDELSRFLAKTWR